MVARTLTRLLIHFFYVLSSVEPVTFCATASRCSQDVPSIVAAKRRTLDHDIASTFHKGLRDGSFTRRLAFRFLYHDRRQKRLKFGFATESMKAGRRQLQSSGMVSGMERIRSQRVRRQVSRRTDLGEELPRNFLSSPIEGCATEQRIWGG